MIIKLYLYIAAPATIAHTYPFVACIAFIIQ